MQVSFFAFIKRLKNDDNWFLDNKLNKLNKLTKF